LSQYNKTYDATDPVISTFAQNLFLFIYPTAVGVIASDIE